MLLHFTKKVSDDQKVLFYGRYMHRLLIFWQVAIPVGNILIIWWS